MYLLASHMKNSSPLGSSFQARAWPQEQTGVCGWLWPQSRKGMLGGISELQPMYRYRHYTCRQVFNIGTPSQTSWEVAVSQGATAICSLAHREKDSYPSPCCSALWLKRGKPLLAPSWVARSVTACKANALHYWHLLHCTTLHSTSNYSLSDPWLAGWWGICCISLTLAFFGCRSWAKGEAITYTPIQIGNKQYFLPLKFKLAEQ